MRNKDHIPALDGLRGCAALLVVFSHLPKFHLTEHRPPFSGSLGVLIFFVLSGFLMGHLYIGKDFIKYNIYNYFIARFSRIVPLFYAVLCISLFISQTNEREFIYYITFSNFLRHITFNGSAYVFWSIAPEVQFYFLFAVLWWMLSTRAFLIFLPFSLLALAVIFLARPVLPGTTAFAQLHIFFMGVLMAVIRKHVPIQAIDQKVASIAQVFIAVATLVIVTDFHSFSGRISASWLRDDEVYAYLPATIACGFAVFIYSIRTPFADLVFGNLIMARLGAYSFSLYLLHEPITAGVVTLTGRLALPNALVIIGAIAASVLISGIVFRCYEMPAQRLMRSLANRGARVLFGQRQPVP